MKRQVTDHFYTPQEVGNMAGGFTAQFIRMEIRAGELRAEYCRSRTGKLGRYRIRQADAIAYVQKLWSRTQTTQTGESTI